MYKILNVNDVSQSEYEYYYSLMSGEKKARVERYRFEKDKKLTVCGEMAARKMLARYCNIPPESITFSADENKKPYAQGLNVYFNISHSGECVICAVSDREIGADIELIRGVEDKLPNFVCTEKELEYINEIPSEKLKRFFEIWTKKEAFCKCLGTGITDIKNICVFDDEIKEKLTFFYYGNYAVSIYEK